MANKAIFLATAMILATPAFAAPAPTQTADASAASGSSGGSSATAKAAQPDLKKYCVEVEAGTGSRLNMTECKTRAQWAKEGVDVDQLKKD